MDFLTVRHIKVCILSFAIEGSLIVVNGNYEGLQGSIQLR